MGRRRDHRPGGKKFTADGFDNFVGRLGLGRDNPLAAGRYVSGSQVTRKRAELEAMYRDSWIVGRMVDVVAEDMVKSQLDIQTQLPPGDVDALLQYMRRTGVSPRLRDAIKWGRLYGGAIAAILIDGQDMATPLDMDNIPRGSFRGLHVLDRWQVTPSTELIADLGPMLGYPKFYTVHNADKTSAFSIHYTRAIRFIGVDLPYWQRISEMGWGASVVERAYDRILALDSATHGSANLIMRSYLRVIGIDRLREVLAAGGQAEAALTKMFQMIRLMQTNEGLTILDKADTFATHNWSFAGMYDALQAFAEQISGASEIPLVRLLGQSPKGFSSGDSDLRTYYDSIATKQDDDLRPAHETLLPILARSLWGKPLPEGTSFNYLSLWQPTETEKSAIATADAQSVAGLFSAGIISEGQALSELRGAGRVTGRFTSIRDEDIEAAEARMAAPAFPDPAGLPGVDQEVP